MGFRTTVVLYNDQASTWENDPELGKKISRAMNFAMGTMDEDDKRNASLSYGQVVECAHADLTTLAVLSGYDLKAVGHSGRKRNPDNDKVMMDLLASAADKLGMKLIKRPAPKKRAKAVKQSGSPATPAAQALGIEAGTTAAVYLTSQDVPAQGTAVTAENTPQ